MLVVDLLLGTFFSIRGTFRRTLDSKPETEAEE